MNKEEQLQRLLRLKKYEQPPEDFVQDFLEKFQRRQRTELLRRSALSLVWERCAATIDNLRRPSVLWSAAGAYAAVMVLLMMWPRRDPGYSLYIQRVEGVSVPVSYNGTAQPQPRAAPPSLTPAIEKPPQGKRRTAGQPQDVDRVIGPETEDGTPALKDL